MITVLIGMCSIRPLDHPSMNSLIGTCLQSNEDIRIGLTFGGSGTLDSVRGMMVSNFLNDPEADILLLIDDDIVWEPAYIKMIVDDVIEKQTVVCGTYRARSPAERRLAAISIGGEPIKLSPHGILVEAMFCGCGFMAIPKSVIAKLATLYPLIDSGAGQYQNGTKVAMFYPLFQPIHPDGLYLADDYSFCTRCREAGFKIYIDTRLRLGHLSNCIIWPDGISDVKGKMIPDKL